MEITNNLDTLDSQSDVGTTVTALFSVAGATPSTVSSAASSFVSTSSFGGGLDPNLKAGLLNLPTKLPKAPRDVPTVNLDQLILDESLRDVPVGYFLSKLKELGPTLLQSATRTSVVVPPSPSLPSHLTTVRSPPTSSGSPNSMESHINPSHILAIRGEDSDRVLLIPTHGLLWAAKSPGLSLLSCDPRHQPACQILPSTPPPTPDHLPVLEMNLPSILAFPLLQAYIYLEDPALLLNALIPPIPDSPANGSPQPTAPRSLSHLLNPSPPPPWSSISPPPSTKSPKPETARELSQRLADEVSSKVLLERVTLCHGLWQNTVALEISDEVLWETMGRGWAILLSALGILDKRRREAKERLSREFGREA
ncbi:hypothetical protein T439DRAFT_352305 [Meredithblackwellia eburnea MCA 4105]